MHYSPIARDFATNRELFLPKSVFLETVDEEKPLDCAILHGWHSLYQPLIGLENALRALPGGHQVRFWRVTYDTHWKSFGQSALDIAGALQKQGVTPQNTLLVGYSMGGVVSRAMIAQGFEAAGALCLCSPHFGPAPWLQFGDVGSYSIAVRSRALAALNAHPVDKKRRGDYFFQAFTYQDRLGKHRHDRIVRQRSALGIGLEGVGVRHSSELKYEGVAPTCDPHLHGMYPQFLPEALAWCQRKFSAMMLQIASSEVKV
jgi:pimeloyl-ACP methyl ester carboxylesterase